MSKHYLTQTNAADQEMSLELGYDRPLEEFFANIRNAEGEVLYTSLADKPGPRHSLWLTTVLAAHGLVLPGDLLGTLSIESMLGGSNSIVEHGKADQTRLDKLLLAAGFRQMLPVSLPLPKTSVWAWMSQSVELGNYRSMQDGSHEIIFPATLGMPSDLPSDGQIVTPARLLEVVTDMHLHVASRVPKEEGEGPAEALNRVLGFQPVRGVEAAPN